MIELLLHIVMWWRRSVGVNVTKVRAVARKVGYDWANISG